MKQPPPETRTKSTASLKDHKKRRKTAKIPKPISTKEDRITTNDRRIEASVLQNRLQMHHRTVSLALVRTFSVFICLHKKHVLTSERYLRSESIDSRKSYDPDCNMAHYPRVHHVGQAPILYLRLLSWILSTSAGRFGCLCFCIYSDGGDLFFWRRACLSVGSMLSKQWGRLD